MPEGDSVWWAARRLRAGLAGQVLVRSDFRVPRWATANLAGRTVLDVVPRGKHLLIRMDGDLTLHTHFRMDGSWQLYRPGERWTGGAGHQIRLVLRTAETTAVGYRLPVIDLLPTSDEARVVGHLGPDVLGPDWDADRVVSALAARPEREIGAALLDQRVLAGLGNIYRTEACFLHGSTPWTTVGDAGDLGKLVERARALIAANIERPERSTTGAPGRSGERFWIYGRAGRPCRRCGARIRRADQEIDPDDPTGDGPRARITAWCPSCQRGPAPAGPRSVSRGGRGR